MPACSGPWQVAKDLPTNSDLSQGHTIKLVFPNTAEGVGTGDSRCILEGPDKNNNNKEGPSHPWVN